MAARLPRIADLIVKTIGRKPEASITQAEIAAAENCSEFVASYVMKEQGLADSATAFRRPGRKLGLRWGTRYRAKRARAPLARR